MRENSSTVVPTDTGAGTGWRAATGTGRWAPHWQGKAGKGDTETDLLEQRLWSACPGLSGDRSTTPVFKASGLSRNIPWQEATWHKGKGPSLGSRRPEFKSWHRLPCTSAKADAETRTLWALRPVQSGSGGYQ